MTPIEQVIIQMGYLQARSFGEAGDRESIQPMDVQFDPVFPSDEIRVIITPTSIGVNPITSGALVGIARDVRSDGFRVLACNSDCAPGDSALLWLAVLERPSDPPIGRVDLRVGTVQPKTFAEDCHHGDWQAWQIPFAPSVARTPYVFLTASNFGTQGHNAAAVGITRHADPSAFHVAARNSDSHDGSCAFAYAALKGLHGPDEPRFREKPTEPERAPLLADEDLSGYCIDSGRVPAKQFAPDDVPGDWQDWEVYFTESFLTPPFVLLTPNDLAESGRVYGYAPAVGIARNVTSTGFLLSARNSQPASGPAGLAQAHQERMAGFYWVAFGRKSC